MFKVFSWIRSVTCWEIFLLTTRRKQLNKRYFFLQYQFTNRVSEDNAELEEEDSGIYWTQDEGAPEDNPGRPVLLKHDWHTDLGIHRTLSRSHFNHTQWCNAQSNEIQAELKESTVSGWQTVDSWRSSFTFPLMLLFLLLIAMQTDVMSWCVLLTGVLLCWWRVRLCPHYHLYGWIYTRVW